MNTILHISVANSSNRALGELTSSLVGLHNRVVAKHTQSSLNIGIKAVSYRRERDLLQQKEQLSRESAEKVNLTFLPLNTNNTQPSTQQLLLQ